MKLRTPREKVPRESYLREAIKLCHPKMLFIICCVLTIGHVLTPYDFSVERYVAGIVGVVFAVLSAYRINEIKDRTSTKTTSMLHHRIVAIIFMLGACIVAIYLSIRYAWWIMVLAVIGAVLMVIYNACSNLIIHNRAVYGITWGGLSLMFSYMLQSLSYVLTITVFIFSAWATIIAVFTLWLWGATTCGRAELCTKWICRDCGKGKADRIKCHSPVLSCYDRLTMPREVNDHSKLLINMNCAIIFILTISLVVLRFMS